MKTYCIVCKKDTENKNPKVFKTKNERLIFKSVCSVYKKQNQDLSVEMTDLVYYQVLELETPLSKIPGLNILF